MEKTERMQARASAIGSLLEAGSLALPELGTDPVERELHKVTIEQTVDDELAAIRARLGHDRQPPALESGDRADQRE